MTPASPANTRLRTAFLGWAIAIAGAIALNITLFGLMPGLIQRIPTAPDKLEAIKNIQVIRIKKKETPPRKKEVRQTSKPKPVKQVRQKMVTRTHPKKVNFKPRLKFELNPKLPAAPMDLAMPPLENFSMQGPVLKDFYDLDELDSGLIPLVRIPAVYPHRAKRRGIEGHVTVEFTITSKGLVKDITIIDAKPGTIFNKPTIASVSQWKFKPPTAEGIPVATRAQSTIRFQLED